MEILIGKYPAEAKYWEVSGLARVALALETQAAELEGEDSNFRTDPRRRIPPGELFTGGVEQIEKAIQLQPNVPVFHESLGWAHLANTRLGLNDEALKSRERAETAFRSALRLLPNELTYWLALADVERLYPQAKPADTPAPTDGTENPAPESPSGEGSVDAGTGEPQAQPEPSANVQAPSVAASLATEIYRKISASRPWNAGIHFLLYEQYLKAGDETQALNELQLAERSDPSNALYPYLLAYHYFEQFEKGSGQDTSLEDPTAWRDYALTTVQRAQAKPGFNPVPYQPSYPAYLAPALRRALGDSLTPETLSVYDRLATLAGRVTSAGARAMEDGYPAEAEELYFASMTLGRWLVDSAMSTQDRYLLHLPELSAGLKAQEGALSALRALYNRYSMVDRLPWLQQQQLQLDQVRQIISESTDLTR